jgi:hypothetical protein
MFISVFLSSRKIVALLLLVNLYLVMGHIKRFQGPQVAHRPEVADPCPVVLIKNSFV